MTVDRIGRGVETSPVGQALGVEQLNRDSNQATEAVIDLQHSLQSQSLILALCPPPLTTSNHSLTRTTKQDTQGSTGTPSGKGMVSGGLPTPLPSSLQLPQIRLPTISKKTPERELLSLKKLRRARCCSNTRCRRRPTRSFTFPFKQRGQPSKMAPITVKIKLCSRCSMQFVTLKSVVRPTNGANNLPASSNGVEFIESNIVYSSDSEVEQASNTQQHLHKCKCSSTTNVNNTIQELTSAELHLQELLATD